jgi:predicted homoserine dehydrogenase-like protein
MLSRGGGHRPLRVRLVSMESSARSRCAGKAHAGRYIVAVADLAPDRAKASLERTGWEPERASARSFADATASGATFVTDDALALIAAPEVEIVIDATGNPAAGIKHVLACCREGKHVVMVNVEADALAGPLLARRARDAGIVYSLAYGDQPALICELVDWCRTAGFEVVAAEQGTKYLPEIPRVDAGYRMAALRLHARDRRRPATSTRACSARSRRHEERDGWPRSPARRAERRAFRSRISLRLQVDDLPRVLRPTADGGRLHHAGQVEVVSGVERDGRPSFATYAGASM